MKFIRPIISALAIIGVSGLPCAVSAQAAEDGAPRFSIGRYAADALLAQGNGISTSDFSFGGGAAPSVPAAPYQPMPAPAPAIPVSQQANAGWVDAFHAPTSNNVSPSFHQDSTTVRIQPKQDVPVGGISVRDLHILSQHDVAVVVDRSLSMTTQDCPGFSGIGGGGGGGGGWQSALAGIMQQNIPGYSMPMQGGGGMSRWDFVQSQTMALSKQTEQIFPHGILLVLFSSHSKVFQNVDLRQIPQIFSMNHPWGSTNTAEALSQPLDDYFHRRQESGGHVKPLVIAVVTDGMPSNPESLRRLIIETTHHMTNPHEIRITFLQIGAERKGFEQLEELDHNLVNEGARYDIVETKTFPQVVQAGLARSLVDAIEH